MASACWEIWKSSERTIPAGGTPATNPSGRHGGPMPDRVASSVAAHAARNRELVALISKKGGDLAARRVIDLHFSAPDEASARVLAGALRAFGVGEVVSNRPESDSSLWSLEG